MLIPRNNRHLALFRRRHRVTLAASMCSGGPSLFAGHVIFTGHFIFTGLVITDRFVFADQHLTAEIGYSGKNGTPR
ncbi:hypothetical protein YpB42003004_2732 [Yersinia pestis biovar Antiqua str. B42003004]|nr:hypothetical protein YpAngola_A1007 [Yersinia pestis Angola]EDR43273.1 hypothetical protein YpE1979001_2207 [Yersinia pestis biovar Antiqua str. E1979001]EDR49179.1 hypothetical protein YpB42003004_2732 [Yersinia pestis biovar Antiqua str. B42003004]EFA48523.1 conserved hypothetical protein [Yersinia pestis KIM D27]